MKIKSILLASCAALMLASCQSTKDIPYMIDANALSADVLKGAAQASDPVLMPGDMLQINVSGPNPETVKPFNKTQYVSTAQGSNSNNSSENSMFNYLIDSEGNIEYPLLGKLHIGGMTKGEAEKFIASQIYPKYLTVVPGVEVRLQNFRVYAIGEFNSPGVIKSPTGRLNILEAVAMAGDLTIKGLRSNIMIVRTKADGTRQVKTVNLNDPNLIVSPDFYLQQNDCIYVQPNESKARSAWNMPPETQLVTTALSTVISLVTFIVTLTK